MNPELRGSAAHVFVPSLDAPVVSVEDLHHLDRVLRLADGDEITLSDGAGRWLTAAWSAHGPVRLGRVREEARGPELTVGCAVPKGDRSEWIVQKVTELGIDRILLFETARSVVHWTGERRARHVDRLRRVAREAAAQSRRVWMPEVALCSFADALALDGAVVAEPGSAGRIDATTRAVLIGPEGGFDQVELASGVPHVALAPSVLRVETAAVVAAAGLIAWRF